MPHDVVAQDLPREEQVSAGQSRGHRGVYSADRRVTLTFSIRESELAEGLRLYPGCNRSEMLRRMIDEVRDSRARVAYGSVIVTNLSIAPVDGV